MVPNNLVLSTGCFDTLAPLPKPNWALVHTKTIYFQDPISIPEFHARFQNYSAIYLLPVLWFMCQGRAHVPEWSGFQKMAIESSIIDLDSYTIFHFNANMSWYASVSQ